MTGSTNSTNPAAMQDNMAISRKIHKQMMNKKNRWRPSELELAVLKLHFQRNQYPLKEEKEAILNILDQKFNTKINIDQLSRWFQHEREKSCKQLTKGTAKNTYKKFGKEELDYLQECFNKNKYPKVEEMTTSANFLGVSLSKIENWYKHNRRSLAKRGCLALKTKKYFKKTELSYLVEMFETCPRPTKDQFLDMAERLKCSESQIKNWYSNKRKKLKILAKKQSAGPTETALHNQDMALFSKIDMPNEFPLLPTQPLNFNNVQPLQSATILPRIPEPSSCVPAFVMNGPLPGAIPASIQGLPGQPLCSAGGLPILIIPTSVNTSSSMIVNTNIINNTNTQLNTEAYNGQDPSLFAKDQKNQFFTPDMKASQDLGKLKVQIPTPILPTNLNVHNPGPMFPQNMMAPLVSPSYLPMNPISPNPTFEPFRSQWPPVLNQSGKMETMQASMVMQNKAMPPGSIPMSSIPTMTTLPTMSTVPIFNGSALAAGTNMNKSPVMTPTPIVAIAGNTLPTRNPLPPNTVGTMIPLDSAAPIIPMNQINPMMATVSNKQPTQIQYQTNMYLPINNNNIYNQYFPVMLQAPSEVYMQGSIHPQANMTNFIPTGIPYMQQQQNSKATPFMN